MEREQLKSAAVAYLKSRYQEQAEKYPTLRNDVTEQGYITTNLPYVIRHMRRTSELNDYVFGYSVSSRRVLVRAENAKRAREVFAESECISADNPYIKRYRTLGKITTTITDGRRPQQRGPFKACFTAVN